MARINIEDKLFADGRFVILSALVGEAQAIGKLVIAWRTAQSYWKQDLLIPLKFWQILKLDELIDTDFAEAREDGVYVRGIEEHFDWIKVKQEAGKKGGFASGISRNEAKAKQAGSTNEAKVPFCLNENEAQTKPLSLSLSLSLNNKIGPDKIIALFNKILAGKGKIKRFNFDAFGGQMLTDFINCICHKEFSTTEQWEEYFNLVAKRPKLLNYPATIWYLIKFENAANILSGAFEDQDHTSKTNLKGNQDAQAMSSKIYDTVLLNGMHGLKETLAKFNETEKKAIDIFGRASEILNCKSDFDASAIKTRLKNACIEACKEIGNAQAS